MKLIQKIIQISRTLLIPCCLLTSCNYLDVIPPAQADFDDTMKDEAATLNFLFTCYGYIPRVHPFEFKVETYASIAWVNASIPVWATSLGGIVSAKSGSTIATSGVILKSAKGYLMPFS